MTVDSYVQLHISTLATLLIEFTDHCGDVAIIGRSKKKNSQLRQKYIVCCTCTCKEVSVVGKGSLVDVPLYMQLERIVASD